MCPQEDMLIGLISGQMTVQTREACLAHLDQCEACRRRYQDLQATWDALGEWTVDAPQRDLVPAIVADLKRSDTRRWRLALAASVALAAGAGILAALAIPARRPATVASEQAVHQLLADSFGQEGELLTAMLEAIVLAGSEDAL